MTPRLYPRSCERAREWASLRLDGELSELEQALLAAHLERCEACAVYAESVSGATRMLRKAEPTPLSAPVALTLRRRRRALPLRALSAAAAAAAVAAAVGLGTLMSSLTGTQPVLRGSAVHAAASSLPPDEVTLLQEPKLALLRAKAGLGKRRGIGIADV